MTMLTSQQIADFVIEALERTAFVLAEAIDAGQATSLPAPSKYSRISYIGPTSGNVYLAASEGFIRELAASILGVEPEDVDPSKGLEAVQARPTVEQRWRRTYRRCLGRLHSRRLG